MTRYPHLYEKERAKIEKLEKRFQLDYMIYDASDTVNSTIQELRGASPKEISPFLEIFLNENGQFRDFQEIVSSHKFKSLDKRIVYAFLSSKSFLEQVNMDQIPLEGLEIIHDSLQYAGTLYKNQIQLIEQSLHNKEITYLEYLKSERSFIQKLDKIIEYYIKKLFSSLNSRRDDRRKREHMESIPAYLEKSRQLIKQRKSNGYLSITMFYILSALIIGSVVIYFFILKRLILN